MPRDEIVARSKRVSASPSASTRGPLIAIQHAVLEGIGSNLERYMDLLSTRQKVVASNIANADTPGYKAQDIDFQAEFQSSLENATPQVRDVDGLKVKNDGNNVNIDRESRLLAENSIRFNVASQLVRKQFSLLRNVIDEGKSG